MGNDHGDILIVDDMPENLRVLAGILERAGFRVRLAPDGAFALRAAGLRRPDIVLLDLRMPVMDGIETCRRLHADPATAAIPVLFLSASEDENQRLESFRAGGVDFITKPFRAEEVLARVNCHLSIARLRTDLAQANARLAGQVREEHAARQLAEGAAQDSSERLDIALAAAAMGTWEVDTACGALRLDPRACSILGVTGRLPATVDELIAAFADTDRNAIAESWRTAATASAPVAMEGWWPLLPGRRRIRLRGEPAAGGRFIGLAWDVTAEHELRERLAQSEKMECLGRLAGGVAHDFNNHLAVIMGSVDLIRARPDLDPAVRGWANSIGRAGDNAAALVRDMLTFARRRETRLETVDLVGLVDGAATLVGTLIGRSVRLELHHAQQRLDIRANREQLQNALLNLCVNARDAMPSGGRLRIETALHDTPGRLCRLTGRAITGRHAVLAVRDEGDGIPDDLQARIFEPFFTTKPEGKGTGLGLATVAGCVRQHDGFLSLESRPGAGSAFCLHLPLAG